MKKLSFMNKTQLCSTALAGPSLVIRFADVPDMLAPIYDTHNAKFVLDVFCSDARAEADGAVISGASDAEAKKILAFVDSHPKIPNLVVQCMMGVGRSQAVVAAFAKIYGIDNRNVLAHGTYNRGLYRRILAAAGLVVVPDPKVAIVVRVKYHAENLTAFILSMRRQRYDNWELIAVTDGPNPLAAETGNLDDRVKVIQTDKWLGHWGNHYRQLGIDSVSSDSEFIGVNNDDNYLTPGYLEQMVQALQFSGKSVAVCQCVHSYGGWAGGINGQFGQDLSCWVARTSVVRSIKWDRYDVDGEGDWVRKLCEAVGNEVVQINRELVVHN